MKSLVALLASLAMLSLGLDGCHSWGGGPCCWLGSAKLVAVGGSEPCCQLSAPPADLTEAPTQSASPAAWIPRIAHFHLAPLVRAEAAPSGASLHRALYELDCSRLL